MWRRLKQALPAASLVAVVYYADNWVLGLPIVFATTLVGARTTFAVMAPIYLAFDYVLGRMTLRLVEGEQKTKQYGFLMRFIRRWFKSFMDAIPKFEKRLSSRKGLRLRIIGFVFTSYFGGAFVTTPMMYSLGQRRLLRTLSVVSAAIYAVSFVAQYALGTSIVIWLIKYLVH